MSTAFLCGPQGYSIKHLAMRYQTPVVAKEDQLTASVGKVR